MACRWNNHAVDPPVADWRKLSLDRKVPSQTDKSHLLSAQVWIADVRLFEDYQSCLERGLPGLLGEFEPHRPAGLSLSHAGPFDGMSIGGNVINPESDKGHNRAACCRLQD
jgi:hypothetical protein